MDDVVTPSVKDIADTLTLKEIDAVLGCDLHGNGRYFYQIHSLVNKGLMSLRPILRLQMIPAYRLNDLGHDVYKELIRRKNHGYRD
jgi:hypothetical protein